MILKLIFFVGKALLNLSTCPFGREIRGLLRGGPPILIADSSVKINIAPSFIFWMIHWAKEISLIHVEDREGWYKRSDTSYDVIVVL